VIVRFVDIGGIVDQHCRNFICITIDIYTNKCTQLHILVILQITDGLKIN